MLELLQFKKTLMYEHLPNILVTSWEETEHLSAACVASVSYPFPKKMQSERKEARSSFTR